MAKMDGDTFLSENRKKSFGNIRDIAMKNKLSWLLKPTLSILDYEMLNSFFIERENRQNAITDYRLFLLKLAQGLVSDCVRAENVPLRNAGQNSFSKANCGECKKNDPKKNYENS